MHVLAHCRAGFEGEAAEDLQRIARAARATLQVIPAPAATVIAKADPFDPARWARAVGDAPTIFARSVFTGAPFALNDRDRITPILDAARSMGTGPRGSRYSAVWLETPDSNEGKTLSGMCRRLQPLLEKALVDADLLDAARATAPRLHVLFIERNSAYIGTSDPRKGSRWPMGIPRVRMPHAAPSRSALKLAEALITFLGDDELELLHGGMRAVDLGAAPGGWSWQLASRGLRVTAVDNGALKGEVADDSLVTHVRADGFSYRPRRPVDWLTCDIVEQPARIAALVARWLAAGDAKRAIFNLKLPMKRRYDEVLRCAGIVAETMQRADVRYALRCRHLYHDREEVTGYLTRS